MNSIAFIDSEIGADDGKILDLGAVKPNHQAFHSSSVRDFIAFVSDELNNHLNDSIKAMELLNDEINSFNALLYGKKWVYCSLLYRFPLRKPCAFWVC